jgi:hypothetical protein
LDEAVGEGLAGEREDVRRHAVSIAQAM